MRGIVDKSDEAFAAWPSTEIIHWLGPGIYALITYDMRAGPDAGLRLTSSSNETFYVAISHVFADGLDNNRKNALPVCQLERIQDLVNKLCKHESKSGYLVPMLLDTVHSSRR